MTLNDESITARETPQTAIQTGTAARVYAAERGDQDQYPDTIPRVGHYEVSHPLSSAGELLGRLVKVLGVIKTMYTVTVRNDNGTKIARQIEVESGSVTIEEVIEEARHQSRLSWMLNEWRRNFGNRPITDWWAVKSPFAKPVAPPIPEPIGFDVLVNYHSV